MFMIPIPPTSKLIAATAPSSSVITRIVPASVSEICLVSNTLKLSLSPSLMLRRSRRRALSASVTLAIEAHDGTVRARNRDGGGLLVEISLPLAIRRAGR